MTCASEGSCSRLPRIGEMKGRRGTDDGDLGREPATSSVGVERSGRLGPRKRAALLPGFEGALLSDLGVRRTGFSELVDRLTPATLRLFLPGDESCLLIFVEVVKALKALGED